jgi:hypothetical protein
MSLTPAQQATLKADILADGTLNAFPDNPDGNIEIAAAYNIIAVPDFTVWRSNVGITETGKAFNGAEWAGLTGTNHSRLQTVSQWLPEGYNAGLADIRAMFDDIWSGAGGQVTRASLLALWKRLATRAEKLYATGTGSNAVPALLVFEGALTYTDVHLARVS